MSVIKISEKKKEGIAKVVFLTSAIFSVFSVIAIVFYIFLASFPAFREIGLFNFLFGTVWAPTKEFLDVTDRFGILPMIVGSLCVTAGAIIIGGSVGIFTAIFMSYFCPKRVYGLFNQVINLLSGIPSIIYGFFGLVVVVPFLEKISGSGSGKGLLASSIILGIMILPTVAAITKNSILAVPTSYYEGALALGSSKEQAVFNVVIKAAKSGIITSLALGIGRAIGETMAVMMIAGNSPLFPSGMFSSIRTLTINIVFEMSYSTGLHRQALIATGFVLLVFVLVLNIGLGFLKREKNTRLGKKKQNNLNKTHVLAADGAARGLNSSQIGLNSSQIGLNSANNSFGVAKSNIVNSEYCGVVNGDVNGGGSAACLNTMEENSREIFFRMGGSVQKVLKWIAVGISLVVAAVLVYIIGFVLVKGLPNISFNFLFGESGNEGMTLLPAFVSTGMLILLSLGIALPIGVGSAIYMVEYSKKGSKLVKVIRVFTDTLAGIPSIVFGLFGMIVFCDLFNFGYSLLSGSLTLVLIVLPTIIRSTEESLLAVPDALREGSLALGASKSRTIFKIVLPSAISGILTAIILSVGRIVGESAALIYTAGAVAYTPSGYLDSGASFAVMMWMFSGEGMYMDSAYATASVLLILVAALNALVYLCEKKFKNRKA